MTPTEPHTLAADRQLAVTGTQRTVAAPTATRVAAAAIVLGVLAQAVLAGGFLAGRPGLRDLHEYVGYTLLAAAAAVLVAGLVGRRTRPEPLTELATRAALVLALAGTILAGMRASRGSADLLMLHIPLAFAVTGLAARLILVSRTRPRTPMSQRIAGRASAATAGSGPDRTER